MIEVERVTHDYGARRALENVSFVVEKGTVVGLVGPNGAGKSTLMRATATLLAPSAGSVRVAGHDAALDGPAVRRVLGYMPEKAELYPELTAWEYLDLFAELAGHDAQTRRRRVDEALARIGLSSSRDLSTRHLSKGFRQRLGLQATLMHDPPALVLDEPTDGLDPPSRERMLADIHELARSGCAVLLSSHVLDEVDATADRVIILVGGRVSREGAAAGRRFRLRVRERSDEARALIAAQADVRAVAVASAHAATGTPGETLAIDLKEGCLDAAAVVATLVANGFAVVELVEEHDRLRDRFHRALGNDGGGLA